MVPPATALAQYAATCTAARHTQVDTADPAAQTASGAAAAAAGAHLTVTPQLAWAAFSFACRGLPTALLHASDQKEPEDMRLQGRGGDAVCEAAAYATIGMYAAVAIKKGGGGALAARCAVRCFMPMHNHNSLNLHYPKHGQKKHCTSKSALRL
jgi:hypothetical protein